MTITNGSVPRTIRVELLSADKVPQFLDKVLAIRNPELAGSRKADKRRPSLTGYFRGSIDGKPHIFDNLRESGMTELNRDVSEARVESYSQAMANGQWWFTPDPIVVSDEGLIINGQHRLIAASRIDWEPGHSPQFVVVWGVDKKASLLMDEAQRNTTDRRNIGLRFTRFVA
jgi:hypothetical protein